MGKQCQRRSTCRLCGGTNLIMVLRLESTPPANAFVTLDAVDKEQERFPLDVFFCKGCAHLQLLDVIDPHILFDNYVYVSGTSQVFVKHFETYANEIITRFRPPDHSLIVDIGSNDGSLLRFFKKKGYKVLGCDPAADIARSATQGGIETVAAFFTPELASKIAAERGQAGIVTANNVFAHVDDLRGFVEGIRILLKAGGVFLFEVSYLVDVFEKTLFDTIYHEHLDYHSVKPLVRFLDSNEMELIEALRTESHGGSLRGIAQMKGGPWKVGTSVGQAIGFEESLGLDRAETFQAFARRIEELKQKFLAVLRKIKFEGKRIAAFGAPAKATTLMYHFGIGPEMIDFISDDSPLKQGLFTPGMHIPVLPSQAIYERRPDYVVILAWNFAKPIMEKHAKFHEAGGRFIIPLPIPEVY